MKVIIGSDHVGFELKEKIKKYLEKQNYPFKDIGIHSKEPVDYPDIAYNVSNEVIKNKNSKGILICATGIGMSIVANKTLGIRAALCHNEFMAKLSREHNDANILVLGSKIIKSNLIEEIVRIFLETDFSDEERHKRRVSKIKI